MGIEDILNQGYGTMIGWAFLVNSFLLVSSIGLYCLWHRRKSKLIAVNDHQSIVRSDIWAVLSTLICNMLIFLLGVFCWKEGYLKVNMAPPTAKTILLELVVFILIVDLLMYVFHQLAHHKLLYPLIHQKHHEHVGVNALSLFVLSPFEALGFGLMLLGVLLLYPFHYLSVGLYFVINVIWGTIGHFYSVRAVANQGWRTWLGTASFHNIHHMEPQANFGFYTTVWDQLFRTYKKGKIEK